MTTWHIIQGEEGCQFAVDKGCVAIVVDALRASATAIAMLRSGATEIHVVREVEEARALKREMPDALLFGERGGVPPEGFDGGNSPMWLGDTRGKRIIFTTTTGAARLIDCWGAPAVYVGTTHNARSVAALASAHGKDVVLVPAGFANDPNWYAQEDWVAATIIANKAGAPIGEGAKSYSEWLVRVKAEGARALFESAPHADKLRAIGMHVDIACCAMIDVTNVVPVVRERTAHGVVLCRAPGL